MSSTPPRRSEGDPMLTRKQAQDLTRSVLARSKANQATVSVSGGTTNHLRYAGNVPSTSGSQIERALTVTSSFGTRTGSATANQLDDKTLEATVRRSEEIARLGPEDPEHMPV